MGAGQKRRKQARRREARARPRNDEAIEHICRTLLRRWGVVFWKLLEREADWLPPWRDLLDVLASTGSTRRKFAAAGSLLVSPASSSRCRKRSVSCAKCAGARAVCELVSLSAADPLNLVGILTPGGRLPALTGNRVLYRDGVPVALYVGGEVKFLEQLEAAEAVAGARRVVATAGAGAARRSRLNEACEAARSDDDDPAALLIHLLLLRDLRVPAAVNPGSAGCASGNFGSVLEARRSDSWRAIVPNPFMRVFTLRGEPV